VALGLQQRDEVRFQPKPGVIGADRDAHRRMVPAGPGRRAPRSGGTYPGVADGEPYPDAVTGPAPDAPTPRVTPYVLRRAGDLCARRLERDVTRVPGARDAFTRGRVRERLLGALRDAHAELSAPRGLPVPADLVPEEQAVFRQAAHWYGTLFGNRPLAIDLDHEIRRATLLPKRGIELGGWVDVVGLDPAGRRELRQLDVWGGRQPADGDPLGLASVLGAVLRLAATWGTDAPLRVSWSDLVHGAHAERVVDLASEVEGLGQRLDEHLETVRERMRHPVATPGADCPSCAHLQGCPAVGGQRARIDAPRYGSLLPAIVKLSPSALDQWHWCPRAWFTKEVLQVPASDEPRSPDHGLRLHALLRLVHTRGSCHDDAFVESLLDGHGADARTKDEVARHARRCPDPADAVGHELTQIRFWSRPGPPFVASARLDAVWRHDGLLDVRDFKTGRALEGRLSELPAARLQAWVSAPVAAEHGLRLRLRYEYLGAEVRDDPDPWEPGPEEIDEIGDELHALVRSMHSEGTFAGVAEPETCSGCRYRSICPESAAPAAPVWPRVEDDA
jgi:hypothetical protein